MKKHWIIALLIIFVACAAFAAQGTPPYFPGPPAPTKQDMQAISDVSTVQRPLNTGVTVADGAKGILVPNNANLNFATGNFSLRMVVSTPRWTENNFFYLFNKYTCADQVAPAAGTNTYGRANIEFNDKLYSVGSGVLYEWDGVSDWVSKAPAYLGQTQIRSILVFNNEIYAATYNNGYLFKWNGTDAWTKVAEQSGTQVLFDAIAFNNKIYATSASLTTGEYYLLEWDGISAWLPRADMSIVEDGYRFTYKLLSLNGKLYAVTRSGALLEWNGVDAWLQKAGALSAGNCSNTALVYNYEIYVCGPGLALYKWNGINAWIRVADGIGRMKSNVMEMLAINGEIYCADGPHLLKYNFTHGWQHIHSFAGTTAVSIFNYAEGLFCNTQENRLYQFTSPSGYSLMKVADRLVIRIGSTLYRTKNSIASFGVIDSQTLDLLVSVRRANNAGPGAVSFFINNQVFDVLSIPLGDAANASDTSDLFLLGGNFTIGNTEGTLYEAEIFNYALSPADVEKIYYAGMRYADKSGSQAALYLSDFSAGANGWATQTGTVTGNIDGVAGQDDTLRWYPDALYGSHTFYRSNALTISKAYRITFDYYLPPGNTNVKYLNLPGDRFLDGGSQWASVAHEFIATSATLILQAAAAQQRTVLVGANSATDDLVYIKNFRLEQIGAVASWTASDFQPAPGQCLDSLENKLHALQPETGSFLTQGKKTFEIRSSHTWAGTHEAQHLGGVNQKILPAGNIQITSITLRSSATGVNVVIGDGSDADRFVESTALASRLNCTIANDFHDGTNMKMVIDPDANFTGTIYVTVQGIILE